MKKILLTLIAIILFVAVIISYKNDEKSNIAKNIIRIGFLVPTLENPFFVDMTEAAQSMETENLKVLVQASQDELKQNQIIENFITQGVDAICVVPINSESIIPAVIKANQANIPIINIDNKINTESAEKQGAIIAFYIGSDNFEGGLLAGKFVIEKLKGKGKVAILEGVSGNDAAIKRKGGFVEALKSASEIEIVASQAADWNRQKASDLFNAIYTANPDLKAVFASNDEMALGVLTAKKKISNLINDIVVIGFDAIDEAVKAVEEGRLNATIAQQPKLMGKQSITLVKNLINKKEIRKEYTTPLKIIEYR